MARIGIMQGRLIPPEAGRFQAFPRERWANEFALAADAGLASIEWIYDLYGADVNPLASDTGVRSMLELSQRYSIELLSVCADYFMDKPLVRMVDAEIDAQLGTLSWLLHRCQLIGAYRVVLPFVDASRIETDAEMDSVVAVIKRVLPVAEALGIELHLETSLPPPQFAMLLEHLPHPLVKVNYDSGNSSSLGYHPDDEFAAYGERIGSVHIKDRVRDGGTVPLGTGDADFPALFEGLRQIGYTREYILQVARSTSGDEVAWTRQNREFVQRYLAMPESVGEQAL